MFHRLLITFATAACLTGVYAVYAVVTRPLVYVPELPATTDEPARHSIAHRPHENVRVAETHLSEQRWAAQSEYMLRAGQSFIYTKKWSHQPGDPRIRFAPFAMVWVQKDGEGREQAVSLVSDSAQLKFASAFDEVNPNPGRVVGAVLDGAVQIKGPDGLVVVGKQFVFDESAPSLVSTNPVQFQYGSHYGRGRNLHMKLIPAEGPPGRDRPHVFGIRTIRLGSGTDPETKRFEHVRLDVRMPQDGQQKVVKIQCSGDLEYDVASHTATFSKSVRAYSWTGPSDYDALDCDELSIHFTPASVRTFAPEVGGAEANPRSLQQIETDLEFRRMVATGKLVVVRSTQNHLRATMNRLEYDVAERRLHLSDPRQVFVSQRGSTLAVPDVEIWLREDQSLQEVLCRGKGRLEMSRPGGNELAFVATWVRQLRTSTDPSTGLDFIDLQQQASFRQPLQQTGLGAERIQLWLAPKSLNLAAPTSAAPGTPATLREPQPRRLVAERDVALVSPQLVARASELNVEFREKANAPREAGIQARGEVLPVSWTDRSSGSASRGVREGKPLVLRAATVTRETPAGVASISDRGGLGPPIEIPLDAAAGSPRRAPSSPAGGAEPLEVTADRIRVTMQPIKGEPEPQLVDVETDGHVKIVQRRPNELPLTAEGDRLNLHNRGPLRETVHLFGQPAHLRDRGLHVEGREVHLDRQANLVSVKGGGLLQLPVPAGTALESLGQATNDPDLDVWWHESMTFDGLTAKFVGKVRAELGLSRMRCEQMDVSLSSRLSFAETELKQQPELATIRCRENVSFENSDYEGNRLVQVRRGHVAEFVLERLKGTSFAQGPGQILVWQRSKESKPGTGPRSVIQANRPINAVTADWNFTQVNFKGRMTGNIDRQRSTFHDSVLIVHGPVSLPNETIDPDHLAPDAASMRCDKLEFTHQSKGPDQPRDYQQLVGWGNAQIEGRGFYANADEISFDGSKGLYMLRAHGNQSAMIARDTEQGPRNESFSRRIEFNPATRSIKVDWASGATGGP